MINSVLLRYVPAKKLTRGETNVFLRAMADQRHKRSKKYDEKCSISNAHGRMAKYWTAGPVSPRAGVGMSYFECLILILSYEAVPEIKEVL